MPRANHHQDSTSQLDAEVTVSGLQLPPDPEGLNDQRAGYARAALMHFMDITNATPDCALRDLLGWLIHLCDRDQQFGHFDEEAAKAAEAYLEETRG